MILTDATTQILAEVERVTGTPVQVVETPDLPVLAKIRRSGGGGLTFPSISSRSTPRSATRPT